MAGGRGYGFNPNSRGVAIPDALHSKIRKRILEYAAAEYADRFDSIDVRFKSQFCYIDAYLEPPEPYRGLLDATGETVEQYVERMKTTPTHLVRLRYFGDLESWGLAFFAYSSDKYELSMYPSGEWTGTIEEAFDVGAVYLSG